MFQQTQGQNIHGRTADRIATTTTDGAKERLDVSAIDASSLIPFAWDYVTLSPPSLPTTVIFKTGGSAGTTVATLTITYSGTDIATVTRS